MIGLDLVRKRLVFTVSILRHKKPAHLDDYSARSSGMTGALAIEVEVDLHAAVDAALGFVEVLVEGI